MSESNTGQLFIAAARNSLAEGMRKVEHCVRQLNEEQVWWRPHASMDSIANLLLHLCGNVRQRTCVSAGEQYIKTTCGEL